MAVVIIVLVAIVALVQFIADRVVRHLRERQSVSQVKSSASTSLAVAILKFFFLASTMPITDEDSLFIAVSRLSTPFFSDPNKMG